MYYARDANYPSFISQHYISYTPITHDRCGSGGSVGRTLIRNAGGSIPGTLQDTEPPNHDGCTSEYVYMNVCA